MRHKQPPEVVKYFEQMEELRLLVEPQCCHTCDAYTKEGMCQEYSIAPPEDFAAKLNECQEWAPMIPF
jgi:hypothetical protein